MARYQEARRFDTTGRRTSRSTAAERQGHIMRNDYMYGSAVPKQDIRRQLEDSPRRRPHREIHRNPAGAPRRGMSLGYVLFLVAALCCSGWILIHYIQLQSNVTTMAEKVTSKERQLNNLKVDNDETLNRINSSIDIEEIKRIAIGELGMTYAREGQIETYTNEGNDYLRYVADN